MRLLLDESLSRKLTESLSEAGHDVVHLADLGLLSAPDDVVMEAAADADRILISDLRRQHDVSPLDDPASLVAEDLTDDEADVLLAAIES